MTGRDSSRLAVALLSVTVLLGGRASAQQAPSPGGAPDPHAGHSGAPGADAPRVQPELPSFVPQLTDEDRRAAFPAVDGHAAHDEAMHAYAELDRFEWSPELSELRIDGRGWIGLDRDRLWVRARSDVGETGLTHARVQALYARQVSRWWDLVAGVRQDFHPDPAQTWGAVGVQGLAPYWIHVEATAYFGGSGRTEFRLEVDHEVLITNRLMFQPSFVIDMAGKADPNRQKGAGLMASEVGLRLRYEIRREIAPYVGVTWDFRHGQTADLAEAAGEVSHGAVVSVGFRLWY